MTFRRDYGDGIRVTIEENAIGTHTILHAYNYQDGTVEEVQIVGVPGSHRMDEMPAEERERYQQTQGEAQEEADQAFQDAVNKEVKAKLEKAEIRARAAENRVKELEEELEAATELEATLAARTEAKTAKAGDTGGASTTKAKGKGAKK